MPELDGQIALVTGGGRGIGANIARELAAAGARVAVSARTTRPGRRASQRRSTGSPVVADVSKRRLGGRRWCARSRTRSARSTCSARTRASASRELRVGGRPGRMVARVRGERARRLSLLPRGHPGDARARTRAHRDHRQRRGVPARARRTPRTRRPRRPSAASARSSRTARGSHSRVHLLARAGADGDDDWAPDDAPWTPPELAPRLVRVLASGRADALAGRYLHAEHDDIEDLISRADEIRENDLNAIRLQR